MPDHQEPITLELAPLPREQMGPFLLLGVDKDADSERIEAAWAERVIWARKNLLRTPLADINWARDELKDPERRVLADATSLNADTGAGLLARLASQYGVDPRAPAWQPLEVPVAQTQQPAVLPDMREVERAIVLPEVPEGLPAAEKLLQEYLQQPLDPWALDFAPELRQDKSL